MAQLTEREGNFLAECIQPYKKQLLIACILSVLGSLAFLATPWLAGQFTGALLGENENVNVADVLLFWILVLLAQSALVYFGGLSLSISSEGVVSSMRLELFKQFQRLPLAYFEHRRRGEVLSLMTNDTVVLSNFISGTLVASIPNILNCIGAMICLMVIDPVIAVLIVLVAPGFILLIKTLTRHVRELSFTKFRFYGKCIAAVEENLQLNSLIKSYGLEGQQVSRFSEKNHDVFNASKAHFRHQLLIGPVTQFVGSCTIILILWYIVGVRESTTTSVSSIVSILLYGLMIVRPASSLASVFGLYKNARVAWERLDNTFNSPIEQLDLHELHEAEDELPLREDLTFSGVGFAYPGTQPLYNNLELRIQAGESIAIIGENGIGKSTLARLLMRFVQPDEGAICHGSKNINDYDLISWRRSIGYVQQETMLFNATIRENLCLGAQHFTEERLKEVTRALEIYDFINELPDRFETIIGDQGVLLSGGQRQRIALARVLLTEPDILILDEATSMFDPENEQKYIENCRDILKKVTLIMITHRPASLVLADKVLKLTKDGFIEEKAGQGNRGA